MLWTWRWVHAVVHVVATRAITEVAMYATISRPNAGLPFIFQAQRRSRIQFGIAPPTNPVTEPQVVLAPRTYMTANTTALVAAAMIDPIVYLVRRPASG